MKKYVLYFTIAVLCAFSASVIAVPTFQVYSEGANAGDYGPDQDTWFASSNPFDILVAGAYSKSGSTAFLTDVVLLISVPDGETGSVTVTGTNGASNPDLLTQAGFYAPSTAATADIIGVDTGYYDKSFIPDGPERANFNNHYPLGDSTSDFLLYDLDSFYDLGTAINDYNADDNGSITATGQTGEIKTYSIITTGFTSVHVDVFGLETSDLSKKLKYSWDISPGSHDITQVPAPGAFVLGSIGLSCIGWLRRRAL